MPFGKKRIEGQLAAEVDFHIASRTRDLVSAGLPEAEARRRARLDFGGVEAVKEECRDLRRRRHIEELVNDLRFALRLFRKSPAFSLAAIGTLMLGIGACTAVFTVVDNVLLRPLPYAHPDRIVNVLTKNPPLGIRNGPASYPDLLDWRDSGIFESVGVYLPDTAILWAAGLSERVAAVSSTSGVLSALGVKPLSGRLFTEAESKPSLKPLALITERTWRRRFGADPKLLDGAIKVNGISMPVVGILPASFTFEGDPEIWTTLLQTGDESLRENRYFTALARLRKGAALRQTGQQLDQICRRLAAAYPASNRDWGADLVTMKDNVVGDMRTQLLVVLGGVGFVWLIVCANIATLLLVRASGRSREMAVRRALGAGRARLARQLAAESLMLVLTGGAAGMCLAWAAIQLLHEYGPADLPRLDQIHLDGLSVAFALGIATITGLLASLGPVLRTLRNDPGSGLRDGTRGSTEGRRRSRTRAVLVAAEVALSIVLLTGSGLLIKSFGKLLSEDIGFRADHLLTFFLYVPNSKVVENGQFQKDKLTHYIDDVAARLAAIPGVQHAGLGMPLPLGGGGWQVWSRFWVAGEGNNQAGFVQGIEQAVTTDYFASLGVSLLEGRNFSRIDQPDTLPAAIINREFARQKFAHRNPLGKRIGIEGQPKTYEIVGVVESIKSGGLQDPAPPQIYLPMAQQPVPVLTAVLRTVGDPGALSRAVERQALAADPDVPAYRFRTGEQLLGRSLAGRRLLMSLISAFAAIALALAVLGLYGVLAYGVAQRTREIGIRMALGAETGQVLAGIVRQGMTIAFLGVVAGLAGALALTRVLKTALYNVSPLDAVVLLAAPLALLLATLLACVIPARRAARVDPVLALRNE